MKKRGNYHVYRRNDSWIVKMTSTSRASCVSPTRSEAVKRGQSIAKKNSRSLVVHNSDMSVSKVFKYDGNRRKK